MTPQQQELIRSTWAMVIPIADDAARIFYDRVMELDPSTRPMFARTDMAERRRTLMQTLAVVVKSIDRLDDVVPAVEALGRRHATYGVRPSHYTVSGGALLDTLEIGLGDAFTPEARQAWTEAFQLLASVMIGAAESAAEEGVAA
jgi:hemoglobin-like flavoprotein